MLGMQITSLAVYCNEIRCIIILYGDTNHISYAPTGFVEHREVALLGCSSQLSSKLNGYNAESIFKKKKKKEENPVSAGEYKINFKEKSYHKQNIKPRNVKLFSNK